MFMIESVAKSLLLTNSQNSAKKMSLETGFLKKEGRWERPLDLVKISRST